VQPKGRRQRNECPHAVIVVRFLLAPTCVFGAMTLSGPVSDVAPGGRANPWFLLAVGTIVLAITWIDYPTPRARKLAAIDVHQIADSNPFLQSLPLRSSRYFVAITNLLARRAVFCGRQHNLGEPRLRSFPPLNLHKVRVHRNHGRPRPNGFTGRAPNSGNPFTPQPERASGKALR
jgi:hypothetical protein